MGRTLESLHTDHWPSVSDLHGFEEMNTGQMLLTPFSLWSLLKMTNSIHKQEFLVFTGLDCLTLVPNRFQEQTLQ